MLNDPNYQKLKKKTDVNGKISSDSFAFLNPDCDNPDLYNNIQQHKSTTKHLNKDIQPLINITILGHTYLALIDSGASYTCAGNAVLEEAKKYNYEPISSPRKFTTAGGLMPCKAMLKIPLQLNNVKYPKMQKVYIIEGLPVMLLGRDFIRKNNISFSLLPGDAHWSFRGKKFPFASYKSKIRENKAFLVQKENKVEMVKKIDLSKVPLEKRDSIFRVLMQNREI